MRLSKIKTKEIRYVVWKYRLKRFLPHILTLCLAVIVAGGAFSAYSVYHIIKSIKSNWQNNLRSSVKKMLTLLVKRHKKKKQH